jgi:hypothetical protein
MQGSGGQKGQGSQNQYVLTKLQHEHLPYLLTFGVVCTQRWCVCSKSSHPPILCAMPRRDKPQPSVASPSCWVCQTLNIYTVPLLNHLATYLAHGLSVILGLATDTRSLWPGTKCNTPVYMRTLFLSDADLKFLTLDLSTNNFRAALYHVMSYSIRECNLNLSKRYCARTRSLVHLM